MALSLGPIRLNTTGRSRLKRPFHQFLLEIEMLERDHDGVGQHLLVFQQLVQNFVNRALRSNARILANHQRVIAEEPEGGHPVVL